MLAVDHANISFCSAKTIKASCRCESIPHRFCMDTYVVVYKPNTGYSTHIAGNCGEFDRKNQDRIGQVPWGRRRKDTRKSTHLYVFDVDDLGAIADTVDIPRRTGKVEPLFGGPRHKICK